MKTVNNNFVNNFFYYTFIKKTKIYICYIELRKNIVVFFFEKTFNIYGTTVATTTFHMGAYN